MWVYRERLSYHEKLRRSLYEILRDVLEQRLMKISLVDSYYKHIQSGAEYSFVEKSELKPKSKKMEKESDLFRTFIVIFCEGTIHPSMKNYIRFFPENKVIKENLEFFAELPLYKNFDRNLRYFDKPRFLDFLESWIEVDYALLIQQDPTVRRNNRYALTHFHVKIDWPIADAAEDLAQWLRYIQTHLYEMGDSEGRYLQRKLFEYYGCHVNVGGRRTAALIAAQLMKRLDFITTVFVSSSESRSMVKYSERGLSKFFLIQFTEKQLLALANREALDPETFKAAYLYPAREGGYIGISEAVYGHTAHAKPPEDGKMRRLKHHVSWIRLKDEFLHPKEAFADLRPINYRWVYAAD
jgi:hypothetical protein